MNTRIQKLAEQAEQEPVAWQGRWLDCDGGWSHWKFIDDVVYWKSRCKRDPKCWEMRALYTTPPKRPWVGLTDEQFVEAARLAEAGNYLVAFQRMQQWLREVNT